MRTIIEANASGYVREVMQTVNANEKAERSARKAAGTHTRYGQRVSQVSKLMSGLKRALVGFVGVSAAIQVVGSIGESLNKFKTSAMDLERIITPLLSLGDNVERTQGYKQEILALSAAMAAMPQEMADFLFFLQSATSSLPKEEISAMKDEALELARATGGNARVAVQALNKVWQVYGAEMKEGLSTTEALNLAQNKLFRIAEKGEITFEQLATLFPRTLAPVKALGFTFDELGAAVISATQIAGRSEEALTGVRNLFLGIERAAKKGIQLPRNFVEMLKGISQLKAGEIFDVFGAEAIGVASAMSNQIGAVTANIHNLEQMSSKEDNVFAVIKKRMNDPAWQATQMWEAIDKFMEFGTAIQAGKSPRVARTVSEYELAKAGAKDMLPAALKDSNFLIKSIARAGIFAKWLRDAEVQAERTVFPALGAGAGMAAVVRARAPVYGTLAPEGIIRRGAQATKAFLAEGGELGRVQAQSIDHFMRRYATSKGPIEAAAEDVASSVLSAGAAVADALSTIAEDLPEAMKQNWMRGVAITRDYTAMPAGGRAQQQAGDQ
jgi:hypothetical protein